MELTVEQSQAIAERWSGEGIEIEQSPFEFVFVRHGGTLHCVFENGYVTTNAERVGSARGLTAQLYEELNGDQRARWNRWVERLDRMDVAEGEE
jgi:hypothetical protein